jgi:hypothetical protein
MTNVEKIAGHFSDRDVKHWRGSNLSVYEQTFMRDKPKDYLMACIELCRLIDARIIVEIGSMRMAMSHPIESFNPYCCNDGHSTAFWSYFLGKDTSIYSVDINPQASFVSHLQGVTFVNCDGIDFCNNFPGPIDFLFLDAWDVIEGTPFAEKHLECFEVARPKLAQKNIICIDDVDIGDGGKGKLIIPKLVEECGYFVVTIGRQAIFTNFNE